MSEDKECMQTKRHCSHVVFGSLRKGKKFFLKKEKDFTFQIMVLGDSGSDFCGVVLPT